METKKIKKYKVAIHYCLWRRKRVLSFMQKVHHLKLTHFTVLVYLRYCLITTKIRVQALVPVVVR